MSTEVSQLAQVIRGPWQRRPSSELRGLVESNLRRLRAHRDQHWARPFLGNPNHSVLAEAWRETRDDQQSGDRAKASPVTVVRRVSEDLP